MLQTDGEQRRTAAREKYKPKHITCLLIAEAPPKGGRHFYFEDVPERDNLFRGVMKVLFAKDFSGYDGSSLMKTRHLASLQTKGLWLLDAVNKPLSRAAPEGRCRAEYVWKRSDLLQRIEGLRARGDISFRTPVILVKASMYDGFFEPLEQAGYNVIDERIPFPNNGRQGEFAVIFAKALSQAGVMP